MVEPIHYINPKDINDDIKMIKGLLNEDEEIQVKKAFQVINSIEKLCEDILPFAVEKQNVVHEGVIYLYEYPKENLQQFNQELEKILNAEVVMD